jgi:N-acetylglucosamine-6-phosphate deacetylase
MIRWLLPDQVFDGESLRSGLALGVNDGRVSELETAASLDPRHPVTKVAGTISPGFLDLQVNGGGGALLNNQPDATAIRTMVAAHRRFGTTGILPTVITDAPEVLDRAVEAVLATRHEPGVLGIHIEGPHISLPRRGTHAAEHVRPLDERTIALVRHLRGHGVPVMITLAPEAVQPGQIRALAHLGAVVSIGHSDAASEVVQAALAEGADCFTHLFNAMSPMLNRAPGVTGAAINSTAYAGIICDGIHVGDSMVGLAIRARPVADRMFLVSDAMATVGGPDHFRLYGQEIHVDHGRLVNGEGGLAGAHVTIGESLSRLINVVGVAPETAFRMAVTVPARLMGLEDRARLLGMSADDLVLVAPGYSGASPLAV